MEPELISLFEIRLDFLYLPLRIQVSRACNHMSIYFLLFIDGFGGAAAGVCAFGRDSLLLRAEVDGGPRRASHSAGKLGHMAENTLQT